jgi:hypothetical protein
MTTTCPCCKETHFEIKEARLSNTGYKWYFVHCVKCGTPVGVVEFNYISAILERQNEALRAIAKKVGAEINL